ncbi:MAG: FeS-binding protein [Desulfobacteraceae bacterium]|jgi:heme A synthase
MKPVKTPQSHIERKLVKPIYLFLLYMMGLTGFGQMPIFKRYYISDIPGLGWTAQFYVTHYMHYLGAIALFILFGYAVVVYFGLMRRSHVLSTAGYVRVFLLAAIVVTGIFRVLKNLPDVVFSPGFTMFVDISHLGFMMLLMCCGIAFGITRRGWLVSRIA